MDDVNLAKKYGVKLDDLLGAMKRRSMGLLIACTYSSQQLNLIFFALARKSIIIVACMAYKVLLTTWHVTYGCHLHETIMNDSIRAEENSQNFLNNLSRFK
jgi:hypothetical protein